MLTRIQAAALSPVVHDAIIPHPGGFRLRLAPEVERPLFNAGEPVTRFVEGWEPGALLTVFQPVLILEFRHSASGRAGLWLLDLDARFIGNEIGKLLPAQLEIVRRRAVPALTWLEAAQSPGMPCERPETVTALLDVHLDIRREIARAVYADRPDLVPADAVLEGPDPDSGPDDEGNDAARWLDGRDILQNGVTLALEPGWRVARVRTLLSPVIMLELEHEEGHEGLWYVDRQANYLGNGGMHLAGLFRSHFQAACAQIFEALQDRVILAPSLPPGPDLAWFLDCHASVRADMLTFHLDVEPSPLAHGWILTDTLPPSMRYTVPVASGRVVLDPDHTRAVCEQFLRSEMFQLVAMGSMSWPSPVDGARTVGPARTFYLNNLCFAYQVHDAGHDLTYYVFATAGFFRTFGVYFPAANLMVALDTGHLDGVRVYMENARARLLQHAALYGPDLVKAMIEPTAEIIHAFRGEPAIHLGHFVWQDLSGVSFLVDAFPPEKLPRFYVFDSHMHPELYGPLDDIFPELRGKVVRLPHSFDAHIGKFYEERQAVIKSTGISVPAQVGRRVIAAFRRAPRWARPVAQAAAAAAAGPVVVIGLRIGNRTVDDMQGFAANLILMLVGRLGRLTVVIDGHNGVGDSSSETYASFGDTVAGGSSFMQREMEITGFLRRTFAGSGATIVDNIGRPVAESVIWCSEADFFVAPWGAALAKYRWICNKPGLTTVGHWNLEHRSDMSIYHHPGGMEDPTPLVFNDVDSVEDIVDPVNGDRDRANYRLDQARVFAQVGTLIDDYVRPRLASMAARRAS